MNPMKKKTVRILFCVLLVAVLVSAFSMTAFAVGDVRVQSKTHGKRHRQCYLERHAPLDIRNYLRGDCRLL